MNYPPINTTHNYGGFNNPSHNAFTHNPPQSNVKHESPPNNGKQIENFDTSINIEKLSPKQLLC
jgi:hypothetical protein